jgi:hypothetical protein
MTEEQWMQLKRAGQNAFWALEIVEELAEEVPWKAASDMSNAIRKAQDAFDAVKKVIKHHDPEWG